MCLHWQCGPTSRNGCSEGNHDGCTGLECYAGDVNATLALGFDSLKLDGCGGQRDIQLWAEMFNHSIGTWNSQHPSETQRLPMMLENCHDGMESRPPPGSGDPNWGAVGIYPHYDAHGELWCPFHTYRSGGDNRPTWGSVLSHLNNTVAFALQNLSVPGCWGYNDMLEVGVTNAQLPLPGKRCNCGPSQEEPCPPLTVTEARSHFGAWAIVSSPLVLGFNLTDDAQMSLHWSTISNTHALEVNQDYAGFSGSRFAQSKETETFSPCDWGPSPGREDASCEWPKTMSWYKPLSGRDGPSPTRSRLDATLHSSAQRTRHPSTAYPIP